MNWRSLAIVPVQGADVPLADAASAQARVDRIAAQARQISAPVAPPPRPKLEPLEPSRRLLDLRIAEELAYARRLLDAMGNGLSQDTAVLTRHMRTLQGFDIVGQMLDGLASIAGARDKDQAVERLGMEDLRNRLRRKSLQGPDDSIPRTGAELEWDGADRRDQF